MPKSEQFNSYTEQEALEEASKMQVKIKAGEVEDYNGAEKMIENEKLDEESYQKFFEEKTNYPVDDRDYWKKKETDPSVKQYVVKDGIVPALIHEKWDHDTDLKSLENVIKYCYENKIYGKTLETAINLITSKKQIERSKRRDDYIREEEFYKNEEFYKKEGFYEKGLMKSTRDENEVWAGEISHIIGHFSSEIYKTGRKDLIRKLNNYCIKGILSLKEIDVGGGVLVYSNLIIDKIKNTGKNPLPFKESGFDNEEFLKLLADYAHYNDREYSIENAKENHDKLIAIKHFDETGEFDKYFNPWGDEIAFDKKEPTEITDGVYVDVDGTLVVGENQLNQKLVEKLYEYKNQGKKVIIFTAGDATAQAKRLKKLGLAVTDPYPEIPQKASDEDREKIKRESVGDFEVVSKGDYLGKKLEITIDDFSQDQLKNILGIFSKEHQQV